MSKDELQEKIKEIPEKLKKTNLGRNGHIFLYSTLLLALIIAAMIYFEMKKDLDLLQGRYDRAQTELHIEDKRMEMKEREVQIKSLDKDVKRYKKDLVDIQDQRVDLEKGDLEDVQDKVEKMDANDIINSFNEFGISVSTK